jgi:hypothetical protein
MKTPQRMMILIAGPYRSGTGDDPQKMAANLQRLESVSYQIFQAGHIPMIGEWVALPIWRVAGGQAVGDALYDEILHPTGVTRCYACPAPPAVRITMCDWRLHAASRFITRLRRSPTLARRRNPTVPTVTSAEFRVPANPPHGSPAWAPAPAPGRRSSVSCSLHPRCRSHRRGWRGCGRPYPSASHC